MSSNSEKTYRDTKPIKIFYKIVKLNENDKHAGKSRSAMHFPRSANFRVI